MSGDFNLGYFVSIVKRDHPLWPPLAVQWQAKRMHARHAVVEKAVTAGLEQGRDLRQRKEHGLGVWWAELDPLTAEERGWVLAMVFGKIGVKAGAIMPLEQVKEEQAAEDYQAKNDALADEYLISSQMPDRRVRAVEDLSSLSAPKN